ncbi:divergent polysaccharide deacetylase family protein [Paenibacillus sp. J5C_2022]|uniref:divergent polysaccharide deacetylase family protein n=1 Tax=Paenibacillus sp. J5C2022 TaxID=2977129 RepID=UPI0021D0B63A|nr:divergent polysaccharide deacetylase family protein [Paenibacillus sp. J5C2022]MCU6709522.1 divergent polysaccharide deacetylase family protein [Paenibacillus sp. J5C2022]
MYAWFRGKKKYIVGGLALHVAIACLFAGPVNASPMQAAKDERPRTVAVVIDDFGNGMTGTEEMLKLPVHFTVAVMPFMPTTKQDAEEAYRLGHDVIVHMPMEPNKGKKSWLGPGALTTDLSDEEVRKRVEEAITNVPHAIGMNNHMGSKVTADERMMRIILTVCKERGLFFLDSRTTSKTVVPKIAEEVGVPLLSNDVFLDDVYTEQHITKQVSQLNKLLHTKANCITIGHVGPPGKKTAAVLKQSIPRMQSDAQFVKLSDMVQTLLGNPLILSDS